MKRIDPNLKSLTILMVSMLINVSLIGQTMEPIVKQSDFFEKEVELTNLEDINSDKLDFCPIPFDNGIIFTSTRGSNKKNSKKKFSDLFYAEKGIDGLFKTPVALKGKINGKFHDGVACFSQDGKTMIFTRTNHKSKNAANTRELKLYSATLEYGYWKNVKELPFNKEYFSSCHPSLSIDGQKLYFSSNRPGGQGGMDIWVANMKDGEWSKPTNLGPDINSSKNDVFPSVTAEGVVYFASNRKGGEGGLDVYQGVPTEAADDYHWMTNNIGSPFNTRSDDFGFHMTPAGNEGFITSSRKGGKGKDDLFAWTMTEEVPFADDKEDDDIGQVIEKVKDPVVIAKPKNTPVVKPPVVKPPVVVAPPVKAPDVIAQVPATPKKKTYTNSSNTTSKNNSLSLTGNQILKLNNIYYAFNDYLLNVSAKDELRRVVRLLQDNPDMKIEVMAHTDARGKSNYNMWLSQERANEVKRFLISNGISSYRLSAVGYGESRLANQCSDDTYCSSSDHEQNRRTEIRITNGENSFASSAYTPAPSAPTTPPNYNNTSSSFASNSYVNKSPSSMNTAYKEGDMLEIKKIYYEFNKTELRPDAKNELDRVFNILLSNPDMTIDILAHTDARGDALYNTWLSDERAKSVLNYLVAKGINQRRLTAKGLGEGELVNQCDDGVRCSESMHLENRRTELRISKINNVQGI